MVVETYKEKKIKTDSDKQTKELFIDDKKISFSFDSDLRKYFAYDLLPYQQFSTAKELARAIIDSESGGAS